MDTTPLNDPSVNHLTDLPSARISSSTSRASVSKQVHVPDLAVAKLFSRALVSNVTKLTRLWREKVWLREARIRSGESVGKSGGES